MNRKEFRAAYREARKVRAFEKRFHLLNCSLSDVIATEPFMASCRYGDPLRFSYFRIDGKPQPRLPIIK